MQYYDDSKEKKRRRLIGIIAVCVYIILFFVVALLIKFNSDVTEEDFGMLIDFGVSDTGMGDSEVRMSDDMSMPDQSGSMDDESVLTQDSDIDAPAVAQQTEDSPNDKPRSDSERKDATQERQVNPNALFPGRGDSDSASDGTGNSPGNQGNQAGDIGGSRDGTGTGGSGVAYNLDGRNIMGALPKPSYDANVQGRVVVDIIVDEDGNVTSAAFRGQGSTTQDSRLVDAAIAAARKSKFSVRKGADPQRGTITYTFRLE